MKHNSVFRIFAILVSACLFIPLFFYTGFRQPFQATQVLAFYLLIESTLPFYLSLMVSRNDLRPNWKDPILLSFFAYIVAMTISAIFGADPWNSFFGNGNRIDGVILWIHLFLFFLYLVTLLRSNEQTRQKTIRFFLSVAGVCGLIGLLQFIHLLPNTAPEFGSRASSTIGNPIFFAATLIIPFFLSIGMAMREKNLKWKRIFFTIAATTGLGIIVSGTRGALVGVFAGCVVWTIGWFASRQTVLHTRKITAIICVIITILIGVFLIARSSSPIDSTMYHLTHFSDTNVSNRLAYWNLAIKGWKEMPWLGVGYQNFFVVADKYYTTDLYAGGGTWPDKPHNQLLEVLVTGGILTFFVYLVFLFFILKKIIEHPETKNEIPRLSLIAALIAYLAQNFFSFDTIVPMIVFIVFVAIICSQGTVAIVPYVQNSTNRFRTFLWITAIIPVTIFFAFIAPTVRQFYFTSAAEYAPNREQAFTALEAIRHQSFIFDVRMLTLSYSSLLNHELGNAQQETDLSRRISTSAIDVAKQTIALHPLRANDWYTYSLILFLEANAQIGSENITQRTNDMIEIANHAIELAPARIEALVSLANMYELNGDSKKAIELSEKAVAVAPNNADALWTLSLLYAKSNRFDEAAPLAMKSIEYGVSLNNSQAINWLINYEIEQKNTNAVVFLYEKSVSIEPTNFELLPKLAAAYAMNREYDQAITTAEKYKTVHPAAADGVNAFIQQVQQSR